MSYQIEITAEAMEEIKALLGYIRAQAIELIDLLALTPHSPRAKELRGKPGIYRIWLAARWRIVYEIDDEQQTIVIRRVRRNTPTSSSACPTTSSGSGPARSTGPILTSRAMDVKMERH